MEETCDTIKFCVKLEYKPTQTFSLLQRGGGILEIRKIKTLCGTHGLSKDKREFKMAL